VPLWSAFEIGVKLQDLAGGFALASLGTIGAP
jgi:hypothetical protein